MQLLDLTLETLEENLALDEALLETADEDSEPWELLRLWEPSSLGVVLGRSSKYHEEVDVSYCQQERIPILRRCSGGASIVTGPGCLMYAVVLSFDKYPQCRMIENAHRLVIDRTVQAMRAAANENLAINIQSAGTSDIIAGDQKFSGNSLRMKRKHFLYHGTLLYDFPLARIPKILKTPPRQPDYRAGREHAEFITQIPATASELRQQLSVTWDVSEVVKEWPESLTNQLVKQRYSQQSWNAKF